MQSNDGGWLGGRVSNLILVEQAINNKEPQATLFENLNLIQSSRDQIQPGELYAQRGGLLPFSNQYMHRSCLQ